MEWSQCVETFIVVARASSFIRAAEYFNTSNSAISKRIQWLEHQLGTTLIRRTTRKVSLTEEGERLFNRVSPLIEEWLDIKHQFTSPQELIGKVKIVTSPQLSGFYIIPQLPKLMAKYPKLEIDLYDTYRQVHLLEEQVDIFLGKLDDFADPSSAIAKRLGAVQRQCFASPNYLEEFGRPKSIDDLTNHQTIVIRNITEWAFQSKTITVKSCLNVNTADSLITAALHDMGIIFIPKSFVKLQAREKKLVPILTKHHSDRIDLHLGYPKLPYMPRKLFILVDYLSKAIKL